MSGILKWIGMTILVICIGIWIVTVAKSCKQITDPTLENVIPDDIGASIGDGLDNAKDGMTDIYDKGANEMSDLKKEAIEAKDKMAMKAEALSNRVFEEDPEDMDTDLEEMDEAESDRMAIAARRDQLTEKGGSSRSDNTRSSNRGNSNAGSGASNGKYFVVTGSFLSEANANEMVKQLKKAGYHNAEVAVFDLSQYYTVFARRYNTHNSASDLAESISQKLGIETYVHEKRSGYRNR